MLAAVAVLLLAALGAALGTSGSGIEDLTQNYAGSAPMPSDFWAILSLPFLLAGMALMGTLEVRLESSFFGAPIEFGGTLWFLPLALTAVAAAAQWSFGYLSERRAPAAGAGKRWLLSAVSGLSLAMIALVFGLLFTLQSAELGTTLHVGSVSVGLFFGPLVLGTFTSWWGRIFHARRTAPAASWPPLASLLPACQLFAWHFVAYAGLAGLGLFVWSIIQGGVAAALTAPLWLPTAATWAFGIGHLSTFTVPEGPVGAGVPELPWWSILLLVLLALLLAVAASAIWQLRRDNRPEALSAWHSWLLLPAAYLAGGGLVTLLSALVFRANGGFLGSFSGGVGLAPWFFLILGIWGAALEASSRYVAPWLVPAIPAGLRAKLAKGRTVQHAPAPGFAEAPAAAAAPGLNETYAHPVGVPVVQDAAQQPQPLSAAAKKRLKVGAAVAGGAAVLVIVGVVAYNVLANSVFAPERQVERYLDALRDGDAGTATQILDPNVASAERVLLSNEIFSASEDRISSYTIRDVSIEGGTAMIEAELVQDTKSTPLTFVLEKAGTAAVLFNEWRMVSGADWNMSIQLPEGQSSVTVNGVQVDIPVPEGNGMFAPEAAVLPVFPGTYIVEPPQGSKYISYGSEQPVTVSASPAESGGAGAVFEAGLTEAVSTDAIAQATAHLEKCLAAKEFQPEGCPNSAFSWGDEEDYRSISWSLETEPEYQVNEGRDGDLRLYAAGGEATVSYEQNVAWGDDEPEWEKHENDVNLYFDAIVRIDGDKLSVEFE
ncbi:hypothetical protein D477_013220 [Arthrobacter crystallopoietes BAB-32]|uniref:Uncharacterized protein n=1 Tax=Arthrobacter crystallopoietes BAB-32 TaxID=1246476 RepID=N1V6B8_9MICC|nr:hypothetical protein D477_013220 [Arthrobacter crystallopoietes BAB-32]